MRGQKRATNGTGGLLRWKRPCHLRHQLASLPLNDAWGQPHAVAGPIDGQRLGPRDNAEESKASSGTEERVNKDCMEKAFVEDLGSVGSGNVGGGKGFAHVLGRGIKWRAPFHILLSLVIERTF
ncbi:hypothetical protein VTJ04DRAFT_4307 [Mycothermus thermophilus]|uniref:uncharacterized protein n=1 Tax=Humicola insolens TaxID=85995 RepID=UPI003743EBF0